MSKEKETERMYFNLRYSERVQLDRMAAEGGFRSRHELARSLVRTILEDDRQAEGMSHVSAVACESNGSLEAKP